jgi:Caspase domain
MISLLWALSAEAAVVPAGGGAAVEAAYKPRRIALLIGVQEYEDPALQGLRYATKDAMDLGKALEHPDVGGFDRVFVVAGAAATNRTAILNAMQVATADLQREDTFLVYMSGHGTLTIDATHGSRLWFLPADGRLDQPERTGIAVAELESKVHELPARRRVLILDTCHNGRSGSKSSVGSPTQQLLSGFRGEPPAPRDLREVSESEARLYAAQYWQPAMEDPDLQNGVYTHYLLEGLTSGRTSADLNRDGLVDVAEAHQYSRDRTITRTGGIQVPRAEYRIVGREEIYLSGRSDMRTAAERALVAACDLLLSRAKLLVNGIPRGELPGVYAVDPGTYTIEVQDQAGATIVKKRVRVKAGETLSLESLVATERPSVGVMIGASYLAENDAFLPWNGSLDLVWARPFRGPQWFRPDVHLGADFAQGVLPGGEVELDGVPPAGVTGAVRLGGTAAYDFGSVYVGPSVDLRIPYRVSGEDSDWRAGIQGGLSLGGEIRMGQRAELIIRGDGYGVLQPDQASSLSPGWGASLKLGISTIY